MGACVMKPNDFLANTSCVSIFFDLLMMMNDT